MNDRPRKAPSDPPPPLAWVNFVLVGAFGLAVLAWVWWFTDWLGTAMVVVGLGGILAWPRSLVGWIPGVGSGLQDAVGRAMGSRVTLGLVAAFVAGAAATSLFVGSVVVRSVDGDKGHRVVFRPGEEAVERRLAADGELRRPFWIGWRRTMRLPVLVVGYPPTELPVRAWRRAELVVPDDLRVPSVLLWPDLDLTLAVAGALEEQRVELLVELPGEERPRRMPYEGRAVWIGCTDDCAVPGAFAEQWGRQPAAIASRWLAPVQLSGPLPRLAAGQSLSATVTIDEQRVAFRSISVRGGDEAQVEEIDVH